MNTFHLTVASPDGSIFEGNIAKLDVRGIEGELAIMAGHIPFVTAIVEAPASILLEDGTRKKAFSKGGVLTVSDEGAVLVSGTFEFL